MADITSGIGSQRALALQKARTEAADDAKFGRKFSDRLGGGLASTLYGVGGGLIDLYSNAAGMFGQEDMAARMGMQSDEMYRRAMANLEGSEAGLEASRSSQIGLTPGERSEIASRENDQILARDINAGRFVQAANAGGPYDAAFDPFLQTGKPNTSFTRKEGESKDEFRNRILNEQSVTTGAPASSYDFEETQSLSPSQILQQKIDALTDVEASRRGGKGTRLPGEALGERARNVLPPLDGERDMDAASNAFMEAGAETNKAKGQEQPQAETRAELLEKYKQEFAEATGIEIDGKPDNSQALMAMGLSLMQNRAGKGFNVGKILNAFGEAGEKAMPYIAKAASEAKAASVSAGKYALEKITNNENAEKAINAATLKAQRAFDLELMKMQNDRDVAGITASGKSSKILSVGKLQPLGADGGVMFRMGNIGGESKFSNAAADVGSVTRAWDKYTRGQGILSEMKTSLDLIEGADSSALDGIYESVISSLDKLGVVDAKAVFEEGVGPRASFKVNRQSMINGFKRLLLQESQVSDLDLTTMTNSFGEADIWSSIPKSQMAIDNMMIYFGGKKKTLEHPLTLFSDKDLYTSDKEYEKVMKHLESRGIGGFGGANQGAYISPSTNVDGVSTVKIG